MKYILVSIYLAMILLNIEKIAAVSSLAFIYHTTLLNDPFWIVLGILTIIIAEGAIRDKSSEIPEISA